MNTALTAPARARHGARMRGLVLLGLLVCSFALLLALTPRAEAFVYWTNQTGYSIGRANNNGTGVNQNFITGLGRVFDIVVDDYHIFWTGWNSIGRASLDGTNVNNSFITGITPTGLTLYDHHVYWSDYSGYIGRVGDRRDRHQPDVDQLQGDPVLRDAAPRLLLLGVVVADSTRIRTSPATTRPRTAGP